MSGENSRVKSLWLMEETGGFGVIPDATGATALFVPAEFEDGQFPKNQRRTIDRNFMTSRNKMTPLRAGVRRGELAMKGLGHGYTTTSGVAATPPPTAMWLDFVLRSLLGASQDHNTTGITGAGTTTTNLVTTSNTLSTGDLVALRFLTDNNGNTQWARISGNASPYTMSPALAVAPTGGSAYCGRTYYPKVGVNATSLIGNTLTLVEDIDNVHYALPGARPRSLGIKAEAGGPVIVDTAFDTDSRLRQQFNALPAAPTTDPNPAILRSCALFVNGTAYDVGSIEFALNPIIQEVKTGRGANGRSQFRVMGLRPTLKINPLNDTALEDTFDAATIFEVLAQFGDGNPGAITTQINSLAVHFEAAQIIEAPNEEADGSVIRKALMIAPVDGGGAGLGSYYFQIGVA